MPPDDGIRDRVVLTGGVVAGVDCPDCEVGSREIDVDDYTTTDVTCPESDATVLTGDQKSPLRRAGKL